MKLVKGGDHRQYFAPCPCPLKSITGAEVKSAPGQSARQAPITATYTHTHTPTHAYTFVNLSGHESGALWGQHTHKHTLHLLGPAVTSCQLHVFSAVCLVCVSVCVCEKSKEVQQSYKSTLGTEKENHVGPSRTCTFCQHMLKVN